MGASVVAGCNAPPVLQTSEHDLDFVALPVERDVVGDGVLSSGTGRDAGGDSALCESRSQPVGVVALVAKQFSGRRKMSKHRPGTTIVACLAFGQKKDERPT